jgi:oligosaccharyltransferase complex subunit alpha (ribophorin I)
MRSEKKRTVLELRPRFPLFGGWNYNWYHGYNLALRDYVKYSEAVDKYVLDIDLAQGITNVPIDLLRMKVVLPEGATDIQVLSDLHVPVDIIKTFTYMDTIGRPTVIFEKRNLVDEHFQRFQVLCIFRC